MKCTKCGSVMRQISRERRLLEPDEVGDMTDGQEAEYIASELNEDVDGEFSVIEITYECPKCHSITVEQLS